MYRAAPENCLQWDKSVAAPPGTSGTVVTPLFGALARFWRRGSLVFDVAEATEAFEKLLGGGAVRSKRMCARGEPWPRKLR